MDPPITAANGRPKGACTHGGCVGEVLLWAAIDQAGWPNGHGRATLEMTVKEADLRR